MLRLKLPSSLRCRFFFTQADCLCWHLESSSASGGLWNIFRPRSATPILSQVVLSLIPGTIAMVAIYFAHTEFMKMASATTPPKPAVIAGVAGRAMSYGFIGLLSTIIPILLGVVALRKHLQSLRNECSNPTT